MSLFDTLESCNLALFHFFNSSIGKSDSVDAIIFFFAQYYIIFLIGACLWYVFYDFHHDSPRNFKINIAALVAVCIAIFSWLEYIRFLFPHPRPFIALGAEHLFVVNSSSFPSGHTIFIFGMATAFYFYGTRHARLLALFFALSGIMVGCARIASGVHYPFDIIGGIVGGICIGILTEYLARSLLRYFKFK